ncbi:toxin-antitoxin system HicB family antitoxin [Leuconostoc gelidum subsp. aenigmaticum]|uniref:toxin-antitoxin system HicB family antitoxin n=1 Tax=Leuconostoc gelidum TaxID=1244 RepID=UPI001CC51E57|nr:toxin-antitoxin system HicB family antitoxin [Leuconostoc gelidum]MBZ6008394.1 toxin-antitoxin system HicB family antitoxin [Leuconostoc gelidum subsp. aenigmaticum]
MKNSIDESHKKSGKIPLRIDPELHEVLVTRAKKEGRSLNNYLTKLLEDGLRPKNFEDRQFVGQVILGENFDLSSRLVSVSGIYYRYLIDNALMAKPDARYAIIEANGNILTLRELK